jgi:two-component system OmpR family response regulator/two-component system response regulator RstA
MMNETQPYRILLVEDDAPLASMVAEFLTSNGFEVCIEGRGDTSVNRIIEENPDIVILDVNLPGLDGLSVCRAVRTQYRGAIIMLTARGEEVDEVLGLEVGADDYLAKPMRPRALLARLRTHLRRATPDPVGEPSEPIQVGALVVDASRRSAELEGVELDLTTAEFELLHFLATNAGRALSRNDIYLHIHGMKFDGLDRSIDLRISRLRKKVGDDPAKPKRIKSVRGVGYILAVEP